MQIENTQINFITPKEQSKESLKKLYDTCNKLFKEDKFFYSNEQIKIMKKDINNIWL